MKTPPSATSERADSAQRADMAQRFGNLVLSLVFYAIVAVVVASTLLSSGEALDGYRLSMLLVGAVLFALGPFFMGHCGAWRNTQNESDPSAGEATLRGRLMYFLGFIPIGLFFCYWAMQISRAGFFPVIPLFVLAGFSSTLFSYLGSALSSLVILAGLQAVLKVANNFWFDWTELFGMGAGMIVFNVIFLIANSAVRAGREAERLAKELEAGNAKLRDYALRAEGLAVAEERNRLAREIHDSLGHALTVINIQVEAARTVLDSDREKAIAALEAAQAYTRQGLKDVREAVSSLRSSPLAGKTLVELFPEMLNQAEASGLTTAFNTLGESRRLPTNIEFTLHRAAQESITNTIRHAEAKSLNLSLDFESSDAVKLTLNDDGKGADPDTLNGYGLLGLRERVGHHGGNMSIHTAVGKGFTVAITLPLE